MHLRLRKCKKLPQTYRKLADLRLRNTSCSFAEFAVAELSVNLRCPALSITARIFYHCNYLRSLKSNKTAHKILIAAQKFKKYKLVRFCKEIFDEDNFDFMQNFDL